MARLLSIGLVMLAAATPAFAGDQALQDENLRVPVLPHFKVGFTESRPDSDFTEFVPQSESVEDWTEMLTVHVMRHSIAESGAFLQGVANRIHTFCGGAVGKGIFTGHANGYVVSMLVLRCPNNPRTGRPETTAFRIIRGEDALYDVQYAWRSVPSDEAVEAAMKILGQFTVCDSRRVEHPCTSEGTPAPQT